MDLISSRTLDASSLSTLAALAALPGPPQRVVTHCEEVDAHYLFVPGDVTPSNGVTSIAPTGGTAGRWLIGSTEVRVEPIGGGANDWPRIKTIADACAPLGVEIALDGHFIAATSQNFISANGVRFSGLGTTRTVVESTMAPLDGHSNTPFYIDGFSTAGAATTLALAAVRGDKTLTVVNGAAVPIGSEIAVVQGANIVLATYDVKNVVGNVLTLDRPLMKPFNNGSDVRLVTFTKAVEISDLSIIGTGDRAIQITCGRRSHIRNIEIQSSFTNITASFDAGAVGCTQTNIAANFVANSFFGVAVEFGEDCQSYNCRGIGGFLFGNLLNHMSDDCDWYSPRGQGGARSGMVFVSDPTLALGPQRCTVHGGDFVDNIFYGAEVTDGSVDNAFIGTTFAYNTTAGIELANTGTTGVTSQRTRVSECAFIGNLYASQVIDSTGNKFVSCKFSDHTASTFLVQGVGGMEVVAPEFVENNLANFGALFALQGTGTIRVIGGNAVIDGATFHDAFTVVGACKLTIEDFEVDRTGGGGGGFFDTSDNTAFRIYVGGRTRATGFALALTIGTTGTVRLSGASVDIGAIPNNGRFNRGTWDANGVAAIAIPFLDTKAGDRLFFSRQVAAGTIGNVTPGLPNVGVGFGPTSTAADTSTYAYDIRESYS